MNAVTTNPERRGLGAEAAQLAAWMGLALLNQLLITWLLAPAAGKTRLLHHAYDLGQLLALGGVVWGGIHATRLVVARFRPGILDRRRSQAALLGFSVLVVGLLTAADDVSNLAHRVALPQWLVTFGLASVFALVLGASRLLWSPTSTLLRVALATGGLTLAVINALSLQRDYFACHLMAAWLSSLLISNALEGLTLPPVRRPLRLLLPLLATAAGAVAVLVPAPGDVRLRLYALPSSVLAPLIARLSPDDRTSSLGDVPAKHRNSPWFESRESLGSVPATGAIVPAKPPIVMFFTVDAFRADVIENPRHTKKLPEFMRLRRESSYFRVARSPTASTMTTMASIFSGKYYSQLRWSGDKKVPLIEETPRFPELLARNGVSTLLVAGTLGRIYGASGVARGFATEIQVPPRPKPATVAVDAIIADLERASEGPLFVYSHFVDPHQPYDLAGKKGTPFQRYLAEVGLVDRQLGRLRAYLADKGLAERTYIIISADHGEAFGEHGMFNHARSAYEELVHVPLFFYAPGRTGQDLTAPVTLMDIGPSVLDLFGLATPGFWMGQSLLPLIAGKATTLQRPVAVDTGGHIQALYLDDGYKVIFTRSKRTVEVYALHHDPKELTNLAESDDPRARAAIATGNFFFSAIARKEPGYESPEEKF